MKSPLGFDLRAEEKATLRIMLKCLRERASDAETDPWARGVRASAYSMAARRPEMASSIAAGHSGIGGA